MSATRPRVLLVAHSVDPAGGGMERINARLIGALHDRVELVVIAGELGPDLPDDVEVHKIPIPRRPMPLRFLSFYLLASIAVARLRRPGDVVHCCGAIVANRADLIQVHLFGKGVVAASGGRLAPASAPPLRRLNTAIARWMAIRAESWAYRPDRVRVLAAVSRSVADELEELAPGIEVIVATNGVDTDRFTPDPAARSELREELGLEHRPMALFVGGDFEHKGLGLAIEALGAVPELELVVVGRGDIDRFAGIADQLNLRPRVHLVGQREDIVRFDQAADVFLCASMYETGPLTLLEAAACAVPIVSTRVGVAAEIIGEDESGGILVDSDAGAIAAALRRILDDPRRRAEMGGVARHRAQSRTWETMVGQIEDIYTGLGAS